MVLCFKKSDSGIGVATIGAFAFNSCSSLTSIEIPDSVVSIGDSVYNGKKELSNQTIATSVILPGQTALIKFDCPMSESPDKLYITISDENDNIQSEVYELNLRTQDASVENAIVYCQNDDESSSDNQGTEASIVNVTVDKESLQDSIFVGVELSCETESGKIYVALYD